MVRCSDCPRLHDGRVCNLRGCIGGSTGVLFTSVAVRGLLSFNLSMGLMKTIRNWWWCGGCAAVLCWCAMVQGASATTKAAVHRRVAEVSLWEQAERGREALEDIPEGGRTRADYTRAMDG